MGHHVRTRDQVLFPAALQVVHRGSDQAHRICLEEGAWPVDSC